MAVRRYRTIEEVPPPPRASTASEGLASACALSELTAALGPSGQAPRGVRRFGSIEDAAEHRRGWERPSADDGPPGQ